MVLVNQSWYFRCSFLVLLHFYVRRRRPLDFHLGLHLGFHLGLHLGFHWCIHACAMRSSDLAWTVFNAEWEQRLMAVCNSEKLI